MICFSYLEWKIINKINAEAEDNPFLIKESEVNLSSNYNNDELLINFGSNCKHCKNHLENQLNDLSLGSEEQEIALLLIQSLDNSGLLEHSVEELGDLFEYRFPADKILEVLHNVIQNLDPAGIGARNFKELIFLQLKRKKSTGKSKFN